MKRAAVGIGAHMGWVSVVTVCPAPDPDGPARLIEVVRTDRLETAAAADREAREPYHVAGGFDGLQRVPAPADPAAVVARGLRRQRRAALKSFRALFEELQGENYRVTDAAILCGRGRAGSTLEKVLASHAQIHVAEGLSVRQSVSQALATLDIRVAELDRRGLYATAQDVLRRDEAGLKLLLDGLRPARQGSWRQEHKLAATAAWITLASC